jgi:uncharacterized SAM-binding protein YcdF (DUF218 family)
MFFVLSKVLGFFAQPANLLILLGLAGALLLLTRFARAGRRLAISALILLAFFGITPVGYWLLLPLEERFPRWDERWQPDGIVVLGGAVDGLISSARDTIALNEHGSRMVAAVELARRYPAARIVFSGGSAALLYSDVKEAAVARRMFERLGIELGRVTFEDRSRNTIENAAFSRAAAGPNPGERWLLITSAFHMPRAVGAFRRVGFPVEAYPVDWRTTGLADLFRFNWTMIAGLGKTGLATHEWVGLVAYWLADHTSELFPGPTDRAGCDTAGHPQACRPPRREVQ